MNIKSLVLCVLASHSTFIYADEYFDLMQKFVYSEKPLLLDSIVNDVSLENACSLEKWQNIQKYAAECSIIHAVDTTKPAEIDGKKIIDMCKAKGLCTDEILAELRKDAHLENSSNTQFVTRLYENSKLIKTVISPVDTFDENSLKTFLVNAFQEKRLSNPAFARTDYLSVKKIPSRRMFFVIESACGSGRKEAFFLKKLAPVRKEEIFKLTFASNYKPLEPYIFPNSVKDFPVLQFPIAYFNIIPIDDEDGAFFVSLMYKAEGTEFFKLIDTFIKTKTPEAKQQLINAYTALGKSLAHFHKAFMQDKSSLENKTITHEDLHAKNVFYDKNNATNPITLIDLERMGVSIIKPSSIVNDLQYITFVEFDKKNKPLLKNEFYREFFIPFFRNYIETFGGDPLKRVEELKNIFTRNENSSTQDLINLLESIDWKVSKPDLATNLQNLATELKKLQSKL